MHHLIITSLILSICPQSHYPHYCPHKPTHSHTHSLTSTLTDHQLSDQFDLSSAANVGKQATAAQQHSSSSNHTVAPETISINGAQQWRQWQVVVECCWHSLWQKSLDLFRLGRHCQLYLRSGGAAAVAAVSEMLMVLAVAMAVTR